MSEQNEVAYYAYLDIHSVIEYWKSRENLSLFESELIKALKTTERDLVDKFSYIKEKLDEQST